MNKTVNINLGGMFFHIDEDAYQKLTRYFEAIKRSLSNSTGQDEILKDIEMRIGELISEKHTTDKQVISLSELDEIIAVMGQPEDYRIEDEGATAAPTYIPTGGSTGRKLYRDTEGGMVGGVLSGLGYYFGIDKVWLRIILLVMVLFYGTGILAYIILWIVMPEARTTAEKLEMRGEPVTISNIEKKVREEFENVGDRLKDNLDKTGNPIRTGVGRAAGGIGDAIVSVVKIIAKIFGGFIALFAAMTLLGMVIGMFTLGSVSLVDAPWQPYAEALNYTNLPLWIVGLLFFLAIGIPMFFIFLLGMKLLVSNLKSIGNIAKYTLLALWILAVGTLIALGAKQATEVAFDSKVMHKHTLELQPNDTLKIKFRFNDFYAKDAEGHVDFTFTQDQNDRPVIYSNNIGLHILQSPDGKAYLQVEKHANGRSLSDAKRRAETITYNYTMNGSTIELDNYLLTDVASKYRNQQVEIYLYLPEGVVFRPDSSLQEYDWSDDSFFNLHFSGDYIYKVENDKVMCLDCPADENEYEDVPGGIRMNFDIDDEADSTSGTTVTVDRNGVKVTEGGKEVDKQVKRLEINEDGVIIKTK